jgi:hypothetical protein
MEEALQRSIDAGYFTYRWQYDENGGISMIWLSERYPEPLQITYFTFNADAYMPFLNYNVWPEGAIGGLNRDGAFGYFTEGGIIPDGVEALGIVSWTVEPGTGDDEGFDVIIFSTP